MDLQELVDWARREPWLALAALVMVDLIAALILEVARSTGRLRSLAVILATTVLVAFALDRMYPPRSRIVDLPPVQVTPTPRPEPPSPPSAIELASLLERARGEHDVIAAFNVLGTSREEPVDRGGRAYCFRNRGVELLFNSEDLLSKVRFFSGLLDNHLHGAYPNDFLPFGLKFGMIRSEAQQRIAKSLGRQVTPELIVEDGDCDKYSLEKEGFRLYLIYDESDGQKILREVQLLRRENFLQQHALGG